MNSPPIDGTLNIGRLHALILRRILDFGHAPTVSQIATEWKLEPEEVRALLRELQGHHGVVLHPHSDEVWIAHPFSTAPTLFSVHAGEKIWWANCGWCALGAAVLIEEDCRITTMLGGHGPRVDLEVQGGELQPTDLLLHFPVPMVQAWDNVVYTCSHHACFSRAFGTSMPGRSATALPEVTCGRFPVFMPSLGTGTALTCPRAGRRSPSKSARELFRRHGLAGPIWTLPDRPEREGRF